MEKQKKDVGMIILIIIFILVFYCYFQLRILKRDYINFFGYTFFRVVSGSMEDTIKINDIVIVKLTDKIKEKDIITYKYNQNFITHRVIKIDGSVITKGDANNTIDAPVNWDNILGKVICIVPLNITIKVFTSPEVVISLIIAGILIFALFHKKKIIK